LTFVLNTYFLPFVSEHIENKVKMKEYLFKKRPKIFLLGTVAVGLLFLVSPYIFKFVYGDAFQNSVTVLRILLVGSVFVLYIVFYVPLLNSLKKYKFVQVMHVLQIIVKLVLSIILIPRFGLSGAAIATVIAYFCKTVFYELYFRMRLRALLGL
jgi:O-antigen/teichoic acid export membrane protein